MSLFEVLRLVVSSNQICFFHGAVAGLAENCIGNTWRVSRLRELAVTIFRLLVTFSVVCGEALRN